MKFKQTSLTVVTSILLLSCGSMVRTFSGATEKNLVKQVSIEQGCPVDSIKIVDRQKSAGNATYALEGCGKRMVYSQVGSVFMESSKKDQMFKK